MSLRILQTDLLTKGIKYTRINIFKDMEGKSRPDSMSQRAGAGGSPARRIWRKNIPESLTQRRNCNFCYDEFQNEMYSSFVGSVAGGALQPIDIGQWRLGVERGDPFRVQLGGTAEGSLSSHRGDEGLFLLL